VSGRQVKPSNATSIKIVAEILNVRFAERNQFHATRSGPADEQALQKCRIALQIFRFWLKPRLY